MIAGFFFLFLGLVLFLAGSIYTVHNTFWGALGAALLKVLATILSLFFWLFALYSCGSAAGF